MILPVFHKHSKLKGIIWKDQAEAGYNKPENHHFLKKKKTNQG